MALLTALLVLGWLAIPGTIHAEGPSLVINPSTGQVGDSFELAYEELIDGGCTRKGELYVEFHWIDLFLAQDILLDIQPLEQCTATSATFVPVDAPAGDKVIEAFITDQLAVPLGGTQATAKFEVVQKATPLPTRTPRRTRRPRPTPTAQAVVTPSPAPTSSAPSVTKPPAPPSQPVSSASAAPIMPGVGVIAPSKSPEVAPTASPGAAGVPPVLDQTPSNMVVPGIIVVFLILLTGLITTIGVRRRQPRRGGPSDPHDPQPPQQAPLPPQGPVPAGSGTPTTTIAPPVITTTSTNVPPLVPPLRGGPPASPPYAPPLVPPVGGPRLPRDPNREPSRNGCDFSLPSWTPDGDAFQFVPGNTIPAQSIRISGSQLVPIGGDYWHVPYRRGNEQDHWFGTPIGRDRDSATGALHSREFEINFNFLSFLVAGDQDPRRLRVELLLRSAGGVTPGAAASFIQLPWTGYAGGYVVDRSATGHGDDRFRQVVWDVSSLQGQIGMLRLVDESTNGHIDVADPMCSRERPEEFLAPIWGWADLHAHPMANWGFGGRMIWGETDGPLSDLAHCEPIHGVAGTGLFANNLFTAMLPEGDFGHLTGGWPEFDGFPRHTNTVHQTMHWEWVRRAFDGGLRLLVALAVNTELLAREFSLGSPIEHDDASMQAQITNWRRTIPPWAEVAETPEDARRIIAQDRLAIVLGIELDRALALWANRSDLPTDPVSVRSAVARRIEELRNLGIRQLNPIHLTNNAFGGAAVYQNLFNVSNRFLRGDYFDVEPQPPVEERDQIYFRMGRHEDAPVTFYRYFSPPEHGRTRPGDTVADFFWQIGNTLAHGGQQMGMYLPPDYNTVGGLGHRNAVGLTDAGFIALDEMRRLGMIVDIDHMSERSAQETLAHYGPLDYPVVSAHATFRELSPRRHVADEAHPRVFASGVLERAHHSMWPHESEKTSSVLSALASLRGMIAPITGGLQESSPHGHQVANDSAGTSKTWAQEFLYARSLMGNRGIGLGTDAVALLDQPGARFGPQASWGLHKEPNSVPRRRDQANTQMRGVTYDGHILDYRAHRFSHSDVYDQEERDIWEATAIVKAGVNPWLSDQQPDGPGIFSRTWVVQNKINNIAKGFLATSEAQLERPSLGSDAHAEQRAAFLVARDSAAATPGANPPMLPVTEDARVRELFPRIWRIWDMWARMERGADGTPNNIPLQRSVAGRRDFDINIDGVAHYGMLTDFLQDLKNVGLAPADMSVLLRSAEDYIEVWERCEFVRTGVQPASMRRRQSGSAVGG